MEQRPSARQRIMDAALTVFSARGYTAAGVEEIAAAAGIKAPSLYKHFKNKRAIFDAILEDMEQRGDMQEDVMRAYLLAAAEEDGFFSLITEDVLVQKTQALVHRLLHDEYAGRFRRLLTIEQFSSAEFAKLYTRRYMTELIDCHEVLFDRLMKRGLSRRTSGSLTACMPCAIRRGNGRTHERGHSERRARAFRRGGDAAACG